MGRLGTFVVVGALAAPLGGMVAADTAGASLPSPTVQAHSKFFDLNGWYARAGADDALAMLGNAERPTHRIGNDVAVYWPRIDRAAGNRRFVRDAFYRAPDPRGVRVARATVAQATFTKLAVQQVRFGTRWSSYDAAFAK